MCWYQDNLSSRITPKYFVQLVWAIWLFLILAENDVNGIGSHLISMKVFFLSSVAICWILSSYLPVSVQHLVAGLIDFNQI